MPIICRNGSQHTHETVVQSKICYGIIARPVPAAVSTVEPTTQRQLDYVRDLKGNVEHARRLGKRECSDYIKALKSGKVPTMVTAVAAPEPEPEQVKATTKSDMVKAMVAGVPEGYFAVREAEGAPITFMRLSRPKHGKFRDCIKVSSQHGPSLEPRWALWPSGHVSVYRWPGHDIEDALLLLVVDWKGATRLYAEKMKKCGRCNTKLTDPRSRFYLIGPECEKHWPWWLDEVAEEKNGYWEQQPLAVQEKYYPEYTS